ncbi:MAG: collagen-like protein, partial [Candidatus Elulimicrobiales bacterium]|nr:collagen-like protein [Candidatus Elulimicrobiales bacterium]
MVFFALFTIFITNSFAAIDTQKLSFWDSFSIKLYCSVNTFFNSDNAKCATNIYNGDIVNNENTVNSLNNQISNLQEQVNVLNNVTLINTPTSTVTTIPPTPTIPSNSPSIKTEYISLIGPMGPVGPMGPMGPKGEKGDTVYVNTSPSTFTYVPVAST